jgi:hypothetical protein
VRPNVSTAFWLLLILLLPGFAQDRGSIEGTVIDAAGVPVPSAKIDIVQLDTNSKWSLVTNAVGQYYSPNMPLGQYKISVRKEGFAVASSDAIAVTSQSNIRMDVKLQLAALSQSIDVSGQAEMLDTSSATFTESITTKFMNELPLISFGQKADITAFLQYLPGAETTGGLNGSPVDSISPVVDGSQASTNEVFVDGAPASDGVFRGSIWENGGAIQHYGEFNAVSNSFSAEYGRTGTFFYSVTVKSGTNELHGSIYDLFVNTDLNARDFFTATRQIYHQNGGGFTLGGPVYIPKLYNGHNRTFFFFGQDLFYSVGAEQGNLLTIPTAAMRQGDFSNFLNAAGQVIPIFDPNSTNPSGVRSQFPGNIIPASRISKVSQNILSYMPPPDLPTEASNWYNRTGQNPKFNNFTETARVDHSFSDKEKIYVSYTDEFRPRLIVGLGWGANSPLEGLQTQPLHSRTARLSFDSIIRPNLINHVTLGNDRYYNPSITTTYGQGWNAKLGLQGVPFDIGEFPVVSFSGGTDAPLNLSGGQYALLGSMRWSLNDSITWIRGHHFLKFGGSWWYETLNDEKKAGGSGSFNFSNQMTSQPTAPQYGSWGSAVASFLLGAVNTATDTGPVSESDRYPYQALFIQDEWHASSKLSLSLGFRWENNSPPFDKYNRLVNFSPNLPNPAAGNILGAVEFAGDGPGTCNCRTNGVQPWHRAFGPRIGYAWQITPKLVMRSSFGIFYSAPSIETLSTQGTGVSATAQSPDGFTPAYQWDSPLPSFNTQYVTSPSLLNGLGVTWYQPNFVREGQILSWTVGFQYQLTPNMLLDSTYIGHHGTHLESSALVNADLIPLGDLSLGSLLLQNISSAAAAAAGIAAPYPGFATSALNTVGQALRPYPQYSGVTVGGAKIGIDRYDSLQTKLTRRFARGLTLNGSFAWSKHLTDIGTPQNPFALAQEVAPSATTLPWDFKTSLAYDLPFGKGRAFMNTRNPVLNALGGGWQLVLFLERGAGAPLTVTGSNTLSAYGLSSKRANLVSGVPVTLITSSNSFNPAVDYYINPAAFANPATYSLGNTARTLSWLSGPGMSAEDASINKRFSLYKERVSMKLGVDFTNPFNFVRWGNPVTTVTASNFGMINTSQQGRRTQINAQILF